MRRIARGRGSRQAMLVRQHTQRERLPRVPEADKRSDSRSWCRHWRQGHRRAVDCTACRHVPPVLALKLKGEAPATATSRQRGRGGMGRMSSARCGSIRKIRVDARPRLRPHWFEYAHAADCVAAPWGDRKEYFPRSTLSGGRACSAAAATAKPSKAPESHRTVTHAGTADAAALC